MATVDSPGAVDDQTVVADGQSTPPTDVDGPAGTSGSPLDVGTRLAVQASLRRQAQRLGKPGR